MTREIPLAMSVCAALALAGCSDGDNGENDEGGDTGTTGSVDGGTGTDGGTGSGDDGGTGGDGSSGSSDGGGTTGQEGGNECDPWLQDCPEGEKCMPWASEGGVSWNGTKCAPLDPDPKQPGDTCTVEGSPASGIDDCDVASMCFYVDEETLQGICVPFCTGDPQDPECDDPNASCGIYNDGVVILCLALCDPLLQDCPEGQGCYLGPEEFQCAPAESGAQGDECMCFHCCSPGLYCVFAEFLPDCPGSIGCCSPFCDLTEPNACPGMGDGEECVPVGEQPEYEHVGVCQLP